MRTTVFLAALVVVGAGFFVARRSSEQPYVEPEMQASSMEASVVADLLEDIKGAHAKLVDLAGAMPDNTMDWRPGEGVRSVAEVYKHVASDNYLLPTMLGIEAPAETGITSDYMTAVAFEDRELDKAAIIAELEKSFAFVENALTGTASARLTEKISMFGNEATVQQMWVLTTTHLHEHLGQGIAYARMNGVVPPWSR
jgi:uncharacterized damage-inducible protein DinB